MGAAFVHLHASGSIIGSHLLPLPEYISILDAELHAASCALQYAARLSANLSANLPTNLPPGSKVVGLSIDSQAALATVSRPGYSYLVPLHGIRKATSTILLSDTAVQVGWTPSHTGIAGNELADAAAKPAADSTPSDDFPWSYSHLRSQIRSQLLREWQVWHMPRDDFPFSPATKLSAIFTLPRHAATRLFQMKLAASYLLGHPNWHRPGPRLCPRCEEEIETTEHALLRCPARQYARGPFPRPWTSSPPGVTPPQLKCLLRSSSAPSLPTLRASPPRRM